ncbi:MAG: flagellar filament capping protein FliD [Proteobacteria bacterium]|nr:flagellar filament capping protein FliD [Pseudomonadota bacterium]
MITATGLGSGLDINGLVTQLVAAERAGSDLQLDRQNAKFNAKFSALGTLKGGLSTFQSFLSSLNTLSNYSKISASSSDNSELSATADSSAVANDYSIDVTQLASAHSLASIAFADSDTTTLGTGTLTIRFGTTDYTVGTDTYNSFVLNPESSVATITIDSTNNTLEGIMGAINIADIGVSASIVNDGSGYRLLMTSDTTGAENALEVSVTDDDSNHTDTSGLSRFAFNSAATNLVQTAAAQNALFTINGLAVSSAENTVSKTIPGVTLSLKSITTSTVTLAVKQDDTAVIGGIGSFIAGYNQYVTTARALAAFDAEKNIPAILVGDFTLRSISGQIDIILRNTVAGLTGTYTNLSVLGITTTTSGTLEIDSVVFNAALAANPREVSQIFAAIGVPDDADITYKTFSSDTVVGNYAVNITTLATAGVHIGAGILPDFGGGGSVIIDSDNDSLSFEIDGIDTGALTLTAGTYTTGKSLADEIQARINGATAMRDVAKTVDVTYDSGSNSFSVTSKSLGSDSKVNVLAIDTNTAADLGFSVSSGVDGVDVAGTIDGVTAAGAGNVLVAASGSGAEGLSLIIAGTATGARGNVNFTRGLANQLDVLLDQILDVDGALEDRLDSLQKQIDAVAERRAELELRWEIVRDRYMRQFNALDILLANLQNTSTFMEDQFKNLVKPLSIKRS